MRCSLCFAGSRPSGCYISIRRGGFSVATGIVILLISSGPVSIAQLIVCLLQIGRGIPLSSGSVSLFDEGAGSRHFFRWLGPLCGTATGQTAREHGYRNESYESW
jgi:hypothetical protein